jgi:hypothetical protein
MGCPWSWAKVAALLVLGRGPLTIECDLTGPNRENRASSGASGAVSLVMVRTERRSQWITLPCMYLGTGSVEWCIFW